MSEQGWHPIETIPSTPGLSVLACMPGQGICVAITLDGKVWRTFPGAYERKFSHWMPLPEPPK